MHKERRRLLPTRLFASSTHPRSSRRGDSSASPRKRGSALGRHQRTVVVAVVAVRVVKMAGNAIIHVVAMRHHLMAAAGAVHMARLMPTAAVVGGAAVGILA